MSCPSSKKCPGSCQCLLGGVTLAGHVAWQKERISKHKGKGCWRHAQSGHRLSSLPRPQELENTWVYGQVAHTRGQASCWAVSTGAQEARGPDLPGASYGINFESWQRRCSRRHRLMLGALCTCNYLLFSTSLQQHLLSWRTRHTAVRCVCNC